MRTTMQDKLRPLTSLLEGARERLFQMQHRLEQHPSARRRRMILVASKRWDTLVEELRRMRRRLGDRQPA